MSEAEGYPGIGRVLVIIPTYDEAENIRLIAERVRRAVPSVDILVADDNSPDGTGALADELAAADDHIFVLHRSGKQGLGEAYKAGFAWAMDKGYDVVVEMDADGSHAPEELTRLLDALHHADVVLGTRYVPGGSVHNWPLHRLVLSRGGNLYIRMALGMPFKDATGGYRAYQMEVLDRIDVGTVASQGYSFQVELAWRAYKHGFTVAEVPITFTERERGASKMSSNIFREQLLRVTVWGVQTRKDMLLGRIGRRRARVPPGRDRVRGVSCWKHDAPGPGLASDRTAAARDRGDRRLRGRGARDRRRLDAAAAGRHDRPGPGAAAPGGHPRLAGVPRRRRGRSPAGRAGQQLPGRPARRAAAGGARLLITSAVGLLLVLPPVRGLARRGVRRATERQVSSAVAGDLFGPRRVGYAGATRCPTSRLRRPFPRRRSPVVRSSRAEVVEGEIVR